MSKTNTGFDFSDVTAHDILGNQDGYSDADGNDEDEDSQDDQEGSDNDQEADTDENESDTSHEEGDDNQDDNQDDDSEEEEDDSEKDDSEEEGDEDEDGEEGDDPEATVISELKSLLGFDFEDEEFPDDVKGIAEYTKKVGEKMGEQYFSNIVSEFPDVAEYLTFRAQGGDQKSFFELSNKAMDYGSITDESLKADVDLQKRVVSDFLTKSGYTDDEVKETVKDYEDGELLAKQANLSKNKLTQMSATERSERLESQRLESEENKRGETARWQEISETVKSGNLKGFMVPENDKQEFYNWMSKPIDAKGTTKRSQDLDALDVESTLALEYLYYKKFDLGKIAKNVSTTNKNNALRKRLSSGQASPNKMNKGAKGGHQRTAKLPGLNEMF